MHGEYPLADSRGVEIRWGDGQGGMSGDTSSLIRREVLKSMSIDDLNGDGIADLLAGQGSSTVAVLSDGAGGQLDDGGLDPAYFTNFAVLLGGADGADECKLDVEGSLSQTTGRPLYGGGVLSER